MEDKQANIQPESYRGKPIQCPYHAVSGLCYADIKCEDCNRLTELKGRQDKQAIEAIAKEIDSDCIDCTYSRVCEPGNCIADLDKAAMILQTLSSLGYVKLADEQKLPDRPKIVCLCGSTRFKQTFFDVAKDLTCKGEIVLAPFHFRKCGDTLTPELEALLSELHFRKIDNSDEVFVLNVGGYIGESTGSELEYAKAHNKVIRYLEPICSQ
jgi:hypothetical protein